MHVRYSARALIAFAILLGTGCNEAIYTLGRLPAESQKRNSCRDFGFPNGNGVDACVSSAGDAGSVHSTRDGSTLGPHVGTHSPSTLDSVVDATTTMRPPPDACPNDRRLAVRKGLSLYLLVDDSLSVVLQPAWNSLTLAISAFVDDPKNTGVGLGIGYYGSSCNAPDYAAPTVRVAPLPDTAQSIKSTYPLPISGKAVTAAVTGALSYCRALVRTEPKRDTAMVLVTDGILDPICGSTEASAAQALAAGLQDPLSVRTYVIGLGAGPSLLDPVNIIDLTPLDALAAAGGTKQVTRIEVNLSTNSELTAALDATVTAATPCAYEIPAGMNVNRAALEWQPPNAAPIAWPHVANESACGNGSGVFVRSEAPGYLELCPASCAVIRAGVSGTIWVRTTCG